MPNRVDLGSLSKKIALNALYFTGLQSVGKHWAQGMGSILMLHHVRDIEEKVFSPNAHLSISPDFLGSQLERMKRTGFDFVSLDVAAERLRDPRLHNAKQPFIAVTLDDGYRDNKENAVPIFQKLKIPYTVYVAPGLVEGKSYLWWEDLEDIIASREILYVDLEKGRTEIDVSTPQLKNQAFCDLQNYLFNDVDEKRQNVIIRDLAAVCGVDIEAHRAREVMTWQEISQLNEDPLCTIGAHTIHHPMLSRLSENEVRFEMVEGKRILEAELGEAPKHFAYPYGMEIAAGKREFELAKECGFLTGVTTRHGVLYEDHKDHMMALPRISLNGNFQAGRYLKTLMSGMPTLLQNKGKRLNVG